MKGSGQDGVREMDGRRASSESRGDLMVGEVLRESLKRSDGGNGPTREDFPSPT